MRLIIILGLMSCWLFLPKGHSQNVIWIGENLTELFYENEKWYYQSKNRLDEIKVSDSKYYITDEINNKPLHELYFDTLDLESDTIRLTKGPTVALFIKPSLVNFNPINFHLFEFTILNEFGLVENKYHLNRFGVFRKSNYKNETLIEKELPLAKLVAFKAIMNRIDIKGMNEAKGMRNFCDSKEYSFEFWDRTGNNYTFVAIDKRRQLQALEQFMLNIDQ